VRALIVSIVLVVAAKSWAGACPSSPKALLDVAAAAFPAEQRTFVDHAIPLEAEQLHCHEIHGHAKLALVTFNADDGIVIGALVSGDQVVWNDGRGVEDCTPCVTDRSFSLADLDGDGRDELLVRAQKAGHMSTGSEWLEVWVLADDAPVDAGTIVLDYWASNQGSEGGVSLDYACSSSQRIAAGRIVVVERCTGARASERYRDVYVLADGKLVKQ
jgi:hypothetical protein